MTVSDLDKKLDPENVQPIVITLGQLQEEHEPWVKHNFGEQLPHRSLLGIVEEIGELTEQLDVALSGEICQTLLDEIKDALADITIYMTSYAVSVGWSMEEMELAAKPKVKVDGAVALGKWHSVLVKSVGRMCHHQLKYEQGIRGSGDEHRRRSFDQAVMVIAGVMSLCTLFGWEFDHVYSEVWASVKKRDWKKNSVNAHETV